MVGFSGLCYIVLYERELLGFWIMGILNGILNAYFSTGGLIINNIFGTLFLGTVYMQSMDYFKQNKLVKGFFGLLCLY